jgi:hypothetical protein
MNQFETRFKKMLKTNLTENKEPELQDSLNKDISLFQDELLQNYNQQYQKEWKKLKKDCKIRLLLNFCEKDNISNFEYLKKYVSKLDINYDLEKMIILKINNIIKIENNNSSSIEYQIKDLKISKSNKKNNLNLIETELSADI